MGAPGKSIAGGDKEDLDLPSGARPLEAVDGRGWKVAVEWQRLEL